MKYEQVQCRDSLAYIEAEAWAMFAATELMSDYPINSAKTADAMMEQWRLRFNPQTKTADE